MILTNCRPRPIPVAGDTVTIKLEELNPPDTVSRRLEDSLIVLMDSLNNSTLDLTRLRNGPVQVDGPTLVAVYPRTMSKLADPELARFVAGFQADLPDMRRIAGAGGLVYEERDGPDIVLELPFVTPPVAASVGDALVGVVLAVPGLPPRTLQGHLPDSVLANAVVDYLAELRALRSPYKART